MAKKKAASNAGKLRFRCARCGESLAVAVKLAGRYIDCPKCQARTAVPASQQEADEEGREYEVRQMAYEVPEKCMKCGTKMKKNAVICTKCGFDYRTGKQLDVDDSTVKEGEPTRGGPARNFVIGEIVTAVVLITAAVVRLIKFSPQWWEMGLYLAGLLAALAFLPGHASQWTSYRKIPHRDHALKLVEDRAERDEAAEPYGRKTILVFFLAVGAAFGLAYLLWGMRDDSLGLIRPPSLQDPIAIVRTNCSPAMTIEHA